MQETVRPESRRHLAKHSRLSSSHRSTLRLFPWALTLSQWALDITTTLQWLKSFILTRLPPRLLDKALTPSLLLSGQSTADHDTSEIMLSLPTQSTLAFV